MSNLSVVQTLNNVRESLEYGAADNLQRADDPNARRIDASLNANRTGASGNLCTSVVLSRPSNPIQEKIYVNQITTLENKNIYAEFLSSLQDVVSGDEDPQNSMLSNSINDFFNQAKILESNCEIPALQAFIDTAKTTANILTNASSKVTNLRMDADGRLKDSIEQANNKIKALYSLNKEMLSSRYPIKLHDMRDALIRDIATEFEIKTSFGQNGSVEIRSKSGTDVIISNEIYSQFSYQGLGSQDELSDQAEYYPHVELNHINSMGKVDASKSFTFDNMESAPFTGGKWGALIELRDKILPEAGSSIKALTKNFSEKVNNIHNSGSSFPPKGLFESAENVYGT